MTKSQENYFIFNSILKKLRRGNVSEGGRICAIFRDRSSERKISVKVVFFKQDDPAREPLSEIADGWNGYDRYYFTEIPKNQKIKGEDLSPEALERMKLAQVTLKLDSII